MPLQSLSQIRANGNGSSSSSGGLKSLQDIRMQQQQQSLMQDYPQMVADEQNYGYSDDKPAQDEAQYADAMKQAYQNNPQAFQNPTQSQDNQNQDDPSRNIPIIGPILRGLDTFSHSPVVSQFDYAAGKSMGVPDDMMTAPVSTGNNIADKAIQFAGGTAGFLTNPTMPVGSVANGAAANFFEHPQLEQIAQSAGNKVQNLLPGAGLTLSRDGMQIIDSLLGKTVNKATQGVVQGGLGGVAYAPFNTLITGGDVQDIPQNMLEQGVMGAGLGGLIGGASPAVGKALSELFAKKVMDTSGISPNVFDEAAQSRNVQQAGGEVPVSPAQNAADRFNDRYNFINKNTYGDGTLALPPSTQEVRLNEIRQNRQQPQSGTEPIHQPGDVYTPEPLALPEPEVAPPTMARAAANPWRQKFENLINIANQLDHPPGRELESLEDLWSRMAGPHDPSLSELVDLAYPPSKLTPDALQRARSRQYAREVAGVSGPVKSMADRYDGGVKGEAAAPTELLKSMRKPEQPAVEVTPPKRKFATTDASASKSAEATITSSEPVKPATTGERLQSLSEVKSGTQETRQAERLQSLSEINAGAQESRLNAEVKPEPRLRDKIVDYMDKQAAAAQERINARRNIGFLPSQGNDFVDHAIIGAAHIVRNGVTYADYSEFMIKQFGNEIRQHLPQIYQQSVNLAKKDAKLTQKDLDRARNMTQFERNNYDTRIPDTKSHLTTKTKADKVPVADRARQAYIKNVDDVHRMSNFDKYASDVLGRDLRATEKTHTLALNSRSSDMISNHILTHDLVDAQGNHIGESFKDIVKQIPKGKQGEFEDYLINKHAITRMQRGEKVFPDKMKMSPEKSMQIVADYEKKYPQFKEIAQKYYDFNRKLGQAWLVDTGMIPQEVFDAWGKENPFYTPMQRKFSDLEKAKSFNSKSGGYGNQPKTVKEYSHVGSERPIISPIESTIEQIDRYVKTAKRNEVMQALIKNVAEKPEDFKGWAEIVSKEKMDLRQLLDHEGIDGVLNQIDEPLQRAQIKNDLTKSNIVNGMLNGEKVHVQVNDAQLLDALSNLHPSAQNFVIATLGKVTRVMKTLTTGFNPLFSLTRNIFRDIPDAYRYSTTTHNPVKFATDLVHAIFSELTHGELSREYKAIGGGHSGNISAGRNMLSQSKNKILQANTVGQKVMKGVRGGFHAIENFNSAFEQGPRLAEFKRSVKQGGGDYNAKVQGLFNANDITVNFNRRGQISKDIDSIVPYYNASVQGLDKFIRSFNPKDPKQMTAGILKAVAAVTIPQMALWEINKDDPNYKKLSNYTKDNYFCIPKDDGTFFKIPKPREIGFVFGTLVERTMRKMEQNDPQAFKDVGNTLKSVFAPPGIAGMIDTQNGTISPTGSLGETIVGPGVDLLQNKDFAGRPIVPKDLQSLSPQLQYDTKTSDIAKSLGNILGKSPKEIDYIIKSYGGVIGQLGIPATTSGNGGNPLSRIGNAINQNVTADPVYSNDISSDFYNTKGQYDQNKADAKSQGKVSNTIGIDAMLNHMSTNVSQLRKQMNTIQNNPNLPDDQKQAKLKAMQIQMNNIQQQALSSLQKYQQKAK